MSRMARAWKLKRVFGSPRVKKDILEVGARQIWRKSISLDHILQKPWLLATCLYLCTMLFRGLEYIVSELNGMYTDDSITNPTFNKIMSRADFWGLVFVAAVEEAAVRSLYIMLYLTLLRQCDTCNLYLYPGICTQICTYINITFSRTIAFVQMDCQRRTTLQRLISAGDEKTA